MERIVDAGSPLNNLGVVGIHVGIFLGGLVALVVYMAIMIIISEVLPKGLIRVIYIGIVPVLFGALLLAGFLELIGYIFN